MRLALPLVALSLALAGPALAQSGGPDAFGYSYAPTAFDFLPIDGVGTPHSLSDDQEATVTLPFAFDYYGNAHTQLTIGNNGGIRFGANQQITYVNTTLPSSSSSYPDLAPLWDDLYPSSAPPDVFSYHDVSGDRFIVSWEEIRHISDRNNTGAFFQVQLFPSGNIEFHWQDLLYATGSGLYDNALSATIGIQDATGGTAAAGNFLLLSHNTAQPGFNGLAVAFSTCVDADNDGAADIACGGTDCDDANPLVSPLLVEACDGLDTDCDPATDENADGDGDGESACSGDCDDTDPLNFSTNPEACDGADNDCNGLADADLDGEVDADVDGTLSCDDCDDADPTR